MNETFTTMRFNNRYLVIESAHGKGQVVVAECYLEEKAALICRLLSEDAESKADNQSGVANQTQPRTLKMSAFVRL